MQKKILFRLFFVTFIGVVCLYYIFVFQKLQRSTSDLEEFLTATTEVVIKVNNGEDFLSYLRIDSLPLHQELHSKWKLWIGWKKGNVLVADLMKDQSSFWVKLSKGGWFLFLPIPDRWSDDEIDQLMIGIPNLIRWESCLVWNSQSFDTEGWNLMEEGDVKDWKGLLARSDVHAPFNLIGRRGGSKIVLDYNRGEWVGFLDDSEWLSEHQAFQLKDSVMGAALGCFWSASDPLLMLNDDEIKKRVFNMDTMCQCNVLESWVDWQNAQWKYQTYDGEHWVASQYFEKNPWPSMHPILKDTDTKVIVVKHPQWVPKISHQWLLGETRYMSKQGRRIFVADDSLSILTALRDTSNKSWIPDFNGFSTSRFLIYSGRLKHFPGLKNLDLTPFIAEKKVNVVVVKNNENWLLRIAPTTK